MIYIEPPAYTFEHTAVYNSDIRNLKRVWELYGQYSESNNFNLAAGIMTSKFVSGGSNERRSHARRYPYREALHAEQVALMSARCDIEGATIYVCRPDQQSRNFLLSLPCFWCMHTLTKANIGKVVYADDAGDVKAFKISSVEIEPIHSLNIDYELIA